MEEFLDLISSDPGQSAIAVCFYPDHSLSLKDINDRESVILDIEQQVELFELLANTLPPALVASIVNKVEY
jgi:hypothetical protein